jgi:MFS family permease
VSAPYGGFGFQAYWKYQLMANEVQEAAITEIPGSELQGYSHAWRALRFRNFRLFVSGQAISLIGTWMTRIAIAWLVYRLTKSPWMLGAVGFANQIPMFLLAPVAGVVIDRVDRHRLLTWTQVLLMIHALLLAGLTLGHLISMPMLFALSAVQGLINTFDMPTRQSFFVQMVEGRDDLSNAIAINSSMFNAARLVGPSIAGLLIAATSEGWCFLVDGISYAAVIASLLMIRIDRAGLTPAKDGVVTQLREGWRYVSHSIPIRSILAMFIVVCLMGWPFTVLMPIFAAQVLHGGAHTLGFLMGALGLGALIASIHLAMRRSVRGLAGKLPVAALIMGGALICFGFSHWLSLSLVLMLAAGFGLLLCTISANTILQTLVHEEMRGRVVSYYTMVLEGMAPWGSLIAGAMASKIGASRAVMVSGVACILGGLWFWSRLSGIRAAMRPMYEHLGIVPKLTIPDVAEN